MADVFADVVREKRGLLLNAAVRAADELGLFRLLGDECGPPMTAAAIAKGLGAPLHRLGRLLDLLAGEQILQRTSTPHGLSYSVIAVPALAPHGCGDWDQISRVIMADEPLEHGAYLPDYLRYVDERSSQVAPVVWDSVVPAPGRLLDLGGGLGAYSRAYVDRCTRNNATLLDLPQVIEIAASPGSRHPRIDTATGFPSISDESTNGSTLWSPGRSIVICVD